MKFYKIISSIAASIVACIIFSVSVFAAETDIESFKTVFDTSEFSEIEEAVKSDQLLIKDKIVDKDSAVLFGSSEITAYKLYSIRTSDFIDAMLVETNGRDIISDDYVWVVATPENQIIRVAKNDQNEWRVLGYKEFDDKEAQTDIVQESKLNSDIESRFDGNVQYCVFFEVSMYNTTFAYIEVEGEHYYIPFGSRPDLTGLENGKFYSSTEVGSILNKMFPDVYRSEENSGSRMNVSRESQSNEKTRPIIISVVGVVTVICIGLLIINKRRFKNTF